MSFQDPSSHWTTHSLITSVILLVRDKDFLGLDNVASASENELSLALRGGLR
jgi:hypothetical protein